MIGDWVKETTTTTGTGTVTLAGAESGYCSFSDLWADGFVVRYQIIDANGTSREAGYGTLGGSGTTLSRDTVIETLVGGTYDASSPAALTLTTGTHTVSVAADSQAFMPAPMGNGMTDVISAHLNGNVGQKSLAMAANVQFGAPFWLSQTINCTQIGVYVNTGIDATTSNVAIAQLVNGISTDYIVQSSIDLTTTNSGAIAYGNITDTILHPGWYMCHVVSSGAPVLGVENDDAGYGWAPMKEINGTDRSFPALRYTYTGAGSGALKTDPTTGESVSSNSNNVVFYLTAG